MNIKRLYVHNDIYDAFLAAMVAFVKEMPYGNAEHPSTVFGPLQNSMQYEKLRNLLEESDKQKWNVALGGPQCLDRKGAKGFVLAPTLIDNPPEDSRTVVEEPFGPIVPILRWTDEADVMRRANASDSALGASVWGADLAAAIKIADQLEAGSVWVNGHFQTSPIVPFGGHKASGIGMDWGVVGLKGWTNAQSFWINK